ncbi:alginate lyase family protein [Alteromonas sp. Mac1]|uniref:alginate lyase family protein n=1 Tax=Alteromonas sp. Mac1 TaxID=1777491 RepID=UPI000770127B|nr:alginate lyase family protein [Alteromonas sp. Mac1]AMJ88211.1 hypothetical protein AV939_17525 [Alteromonas sp. Mac1]AMJ92068.1 hypothetical protein AV940_17225 [Alteromonas sp. Mac2]
MQNNEARKVFEEANLFLQDGAYKEAADKFKKAVAKGYDIELSMHNASLSYLLGGDFEKADVELYRALERFPKSSLLNTLHNSMAEEHLKANQKPKLSIIVPVYNSGEYLEKCINSILKQTFTDFELIIVNDGSTDDSASIIDKARIKDNRIKVITNIKPSGNPGSPRNQALEIAKGAYIGFVDSDDWIDADYYEILMTNAISRNADIVFCSGFVNEIGDEQQLREYSENCLEKPGEILNKYHESFMIWDKVFSSRIIRSFNLRLGETKAAVDVPFIIQSYYYAHRTHICKGYNGYHYRRESSSSVTVNYRKSSDCHFEVVAFDNVAKWAKTENITKAYASQVDFRKVSSFIYTLSVIAPKMFDGFYEKVQTTFKGIDEKEIKRFVKKTGREHVLRKYKHILNKDAKSYKDAYRKDISLARKGKISTPKKTDVPIEQRNTFGLKGSNKGIMFFPDWSAKNPYQKLLYAAVADNFDINVKGYKETLLCPELLEKNNDEFDCLHFHWLHVHIDFSKDTGADKFVENILYAKKLGYRVLYTAHNIISHDSDHPERELALRKKVIGLFDNILVHGELAKQRIVNEIGAEESKVSIVPHGSYEGYYPNYADRKSSRAYFSIPETDFVYLFFGNIKGYKGVDELLTSYERVRESRNNCKLIIAGRIFDEEAGQLIDGYVARDSSIICKPGFIEEHDVQYYFNAADVVVLPYKKILTSGAATLSFAFKKKVIAPKQGLLPELIEDGTQGFLFDDFEHMHELMLKVQDLTCLNNDTVDSFKDLNETLKWSNITASLPFNNLFSKRLNETVSEAPKYEYALIRILGNDLPQRHTPMQTYQNLEFTLKNESDFDGCHKLWILNRIIDSEKKAAIIELLKKYGKNYVDIPYNATELVEVPICYEDLLVNEYFLTDDFEKLEERHKVIAKTALLKHKNNYIMNNNGARNRALLEGRLLAKWVFPWDGNCYLTDKAWESLTESLIARDDAKYHIVPMDRVLSNEQLLEPNYIANPSEEPQIIFRNDAQKSFDENLMYGLKPKVDLLKKLGVPGVWDKWNNLYPWKKHVISYERDSFNYVWSGWTARLFSGNQSQEVDAHQRALNREKGIVSFIENHDKGELFRNYDKGSLAYFNESILDEVKNSTISNNVFESTLALLKENADLFVNKDSYSVTTKTTLPPSGDIHDYWHPAPYAWPNPETSDGLPYIHKDGQRVPGTRMYEEESIKYDRTSLQRLFDETTTLALAGYVFSSDNYLETAYRHIKTWFINPETVMNPNFNFAQVVMGRNDNKGTASGLIEMKDLYFFLDAVRIVKKSKFWQEEDSGVIDKWFAEYYQWLNSSAQGLAETKAKNNHGNSYDLQVFAIASFLGLTNEMYDIYVRAGSRIKSHVELNGEQPHELKRTTTAHYTAFNLHLWISLDTLVQNTLGRSYFNSVQFYGNESMRALEKASEWVLSYGVLPEWPFKQIDQFDKSRYEHIFHSLKSSGFDSMNRYSSFYPDLASSKDLYFPHDGIAPYWKLSLISAKS